MSKTHSGLYENPCVLTGSICILYKAYYYLMESQANEVVLGSGRSIPLVQDAQHYMYTGAEQLPLPRPTHTPVS